MADVGVEVANALHWDLAIPRYRVTAQVESGVVTLLGVVERPYLRSYAESIVRRVSGVTSVRNKIAVRTAEESRPSTERH
jgi:osmotically-inducible protein OsmY